MLIHYIYSTVNKKSARKKFKTFQLQITKAQCKFKCLQQNSSQDLALSVKPDNT